MILDLTMPHLDGVRTFRRLRDIRSDLPVIVSSGYSQQDVDDRFRDENPAAFIQKPYEIGTLLAAVRQVLEPES